MRWNVFCNSQHSIHSFCKFLFSSKYILLSHTGIRLALSLYEIQFLYEKIKELREEKKLSQDKLAKELGVSQNTISQCETGEREPDITTLKRLCQFFDVTAGYILDMKD
ncbi:MAG: helix-turn-helix domain-containing protein [Firmicutes bacterium]|nr:helix-turn-helix domain-containing protein [Bacillota bacterium]